MIDTSYIDHLAYCASNVAYEFDVNGKFLPEKYPKRYQDDPYLDVLRKHGMHNITPYSNSEGWFWDKINAAIFIELQSINILAFRGTIPPNCSCLAFQDWMNDLIVSTKKVRGFKGKVHTGIYDAYKTLRKSIFTDLKKRADKPLLITGHSKGGPMTTYAAYDAINSKLNVAHVITFASARPGDETFASSYNSLLKEKSLVQIRYENDLDAVPLLPPERDHSNEYAFVLGVLAAYLKEHKHPTMADAVIAFAGLLEENYQWNYKPVGKLQYITKDHQIVNWSQHLWGVRETQFQNQFFDDPITFLYYVIKAHSVSIGGGYQKGVFPGIPH